MSFLEEVFEVSPRRTSKAEVVDYYRSQYPGSKTDKRGRTIEAWRSKAADVYQQVTGLNRNSALREFQGTRANSSGRTNRETWETIGDMLPPMVPENGYLITGTVWVKFSDGQCEERELTDERITGKEARALLKAAIEENERQLEDYALNHYMTDSIDDSEHEARYGDCQAPDLHIQAIE